MRLSLSTLLAKFDQFKRSNLSMVDLSNSPKLADNLIPLAALHSGQSARVGQLNGTGDLIHRLREMGLRIGAHIRVLRSGCPCIIRLNGQTLCIRTSEVCQVMVRAGCPEASDRADSGVGSN